MDLITKNDKYMSDEWFNELTSEMNKHLKLEWKSAVEEEYTYGTYIYEPKQRKDNMALRFPGATRGHIEIDENMIITDIVLYDTAFNNCVSCYEKSVKDAVKMFIGSKIVLSD